MLIKNANIFVGKTFMQGDIVPEVTWPIRVPSGAAIS